MEKVAPGSVLNRVWEAVDAVRDRLTRATAALEAAGVPYAVAGGNAVAAWVATIDRAAVRFTQDVDILLRRDDLDAATAALAAAGFIRRHSASIEKFLDGPDAKARDAVHVLIAEERVRPADLAPTPSVEDYARPDPLYRSVALDALVRMKLTSYRRKDQVHLEDMLGVGLIDASWVARLPPELGARLQHLIDTPEG